MSDGYLYVSTIKFRFRARALDEAAHRHREAQKVARQELAGNLDTATVEAVVSDIRYDPEDREGNFAKL